VVLSPLDIEETGAMGREIDSLQSIPRVEAIKNNDNKHKNMYSF
jgi:hypothetical protein